MGTTAGKQRDDVKDWTRQYFDTVYMRRWGLGPPDDALRDKVQFLARQLEAEAGYSLIDVGCGQGRYSLAFAERGLDVVGLDASGALLAEARRLGQASGLDVDWVQGDMRDLPYDSEFDHALLLDSFGFFALESDDAAVLGQLGKVLRPGGQAAIAVVNGERILAGFEPRAEERAGGTTVTIQRELDRESRILKELVTVNWAGGRSEGERRQRLYSGEQVSAMVLRAGFRVSAIFGDFSESPYDREASPRIVLIGVRRSGGA